jgi:HK97 family phage major capsid protein
MPPKEDPAMTGTVSAGFLRELEHRRDQIRATAETMLLNAAAEGRADLNAGEAARFAQAKRDLRGITEHIEQIREDLDRSTIPDRYRGKLTRRLNSGARVAPIGFDAEELRHAHGKLLAGEAVRLEARDFTTATPILPAELAPFVTELQHEGRILDRLPAFGLEAPSIEIIQINSVTGSPAITPEGSLKPEVTPVATPLTVTAQKIAAHTGLSYEALSDFDTFSNYVRVELQRQVIQTENNELLYGTGGATGIFGFLTASGGLSFDASTATQGIDAIEQAIAAMRVGPSLATPNLCVLNPLAWSSIRRTEDTLGRYLLSADPAEDEADSIWGIEVVTTTQCHPADGLLVDTTKYGRAVVREPLSMRIGWANDDFTRNILRTVCEERLNNAIERPTAILHIQNLSTTVVAAEAEESPPPKASK